VRFGFVVKQGRLEGAFGPVATVEVAVADGFGDVMGLQVFTSYVPMADCLGTMMG